MNEEQKDQTIAIPDTGVQMVQVTKKQWQAVCALVSAFQPTMQALASADDAYGLCPHCEQVFPKKRPDQVYCCPLHQHDFWSKARRKKLKAERLAAKQAFQAAVDAPMPALPEYGEEIQCGMTGCENKFRLEKGVTFGSFCPDCRRQVLENRTKQ